MIGGELVHRIGSNLGGVEMTGASRVCKSLVLIGLEGPEIQGKTILKLDWRDLRSPKENDEYLRNE